MDSKRYEIMLSVITILTVIVTSVGVTFAYFTTGISGNAADVSATTSKIGGVTFDGGSDFTTASEIEPGWTESKTFTISVAPSDSEQTVYVKMTYTNGMPDLTCNVSDVSNGAKGDISLDSTGVETTAILVEKTFAPSDDIQTITYTLTMALPETGENQNASQGKEFDGLLFAEFGSQNLYFNNDNPNGTTTKPTV